MNYLVKGSRRNINNKKKIKSVKRYRNRSCRQIGGINDERMYYNVYFNYIISNFGNPYQTNGQFLTRQINNFEHRTCWDYITETRDIVIEDHAPQLANLRVVNLSQLGQPRNNKHFNLELYTINKTRQESLGLINDLMYELGGSGWIEFNVNESADINRYYSSYDPADIDIVEIVISGGFYE